MIKWSPCLAVPACALLIMGSVVVQPSWFLSVDPCVDLRVDFDCAFAVWRCLLWTNHESCTLTTIKQHFVLRLSLPPFARKWVCTISRDGAWYGAMKLHREVHLILLGLIHFFGHFGLIVSNWTGFKVGLSVMWCEEVKQSRESSWSSSFMVFCMIHNSVVVKDFLPWYIAMSKVMSSSVVAIGRSKV